MKKIAAIVLVIAMAFSLCACSAGQSAEKPKGEENQAEDAQAESEAIAMSKEEMISQATEIGDWVQDMNDNPVRAEEEYVGNVYFVTGRVDNISADGVMVKGIKISLPKENIMELSKNYVIQVVGKLDSLSCETSGNSKTYHANMQNAYLLELGADYPIVIGGKNSSMSKTSEVYNYQLQGIDSDYWQLVYFKEGEDISSLKDTSFWNTKEIIVHGHMQEDADIIDATIVK